MDVDAGDDPGMVVCGGTGLGFLALYEIGFGGSDPAAGAAASAPSAKLRLGPMTGIGPGIAVGAGLGAFGVAVDSFGCRKDIIATPALAAAR